MISVLCVNRNTLYKRLRGDYDLDLWDIDRDAYNYSGNNMVITHAPCSQWSARLSVQATPNEYEKRLAFFCLEQVQKNGGIFEHPAHSSFFKIANIEPTIEIDQFDFGFRSKKRTWLYFHGCKPIDYVPQFASYNYTSVTRLDSRERSRMTKTFCEYLICCVLKKVNTKNQVFLA